MQYKVNIQKYLEIRNNKAAINFQNEIENESIWLLRNAKTYLQKLTQRTAWRGL